MSTSDGITPVILSGGAGTRLWPLSRKLRPKQFLGLLNDSPNLFSATLQRVHGAPFGPPIIIGNHEHRFLIGEELKLAGVRAKEIVLEPLARNTAPAIAVAAVLAAAEQPGRLLLVLPSDHEISDVDEFHNAVLRGAPLAEDGYLVTFGVHPTKAETGYGYIQTGEDVGDGYEVRRFVEKPDQATAEAYLQGGDYLWNAGIFLFRADRILASLEKHQPAVLDAARRAVDAAKRDLDFVRLDPPAFEAAPSISFDYAVMERAAQAAVIPLNADWSDVGSWESLAEMGDADEFGNVRIGDSVLLDARNNYIRTEKHLIAAVGVDDLVIVATDDSVLVLPKSRSQEVKEVVDQIAAAGREESELHSRVFRPWGHYQNLDAGAGFLVKQIVVNPGAKLSLQHHNHRAEHWVVVDGVARVTNGDDTFDLESNQSTYIPVGVRHRLENPGEEPLRLIEVQTGEVISEDDIVRLDDAYGRTEI